jgi:hypothetical protein
VSVFHAIIGLGPALAAGVLLPVFLSSVHHKIGDGPAFVETVRQYELLPAGLVKPAYLLLVAIETAILVGLVFAATRLPALGSAALLLALYGAAMAVNLARGRAEISCGCGGGETIAWRMVARNGFLASLATGCLVLPVGEAVPAVAGIAALALGATATVLAVTLAALCNGNAQWHAQTGTER